MKKRLLTTLLALVMALALLPTATLAADKSPFTDVPQDAWYREDVEAVRETGLFNGTSETTFSPDGTLSLAQAIVLAARLHQHLTEGSVTLTSGEGAWYDTFLAYAKENGIVTNFYDPYLNEDATRGEMAQIFYQALPAETCKVINQVEDNAIPDVKLSYDCGEAVYALYRAGILTGSDRTFKVLPSGSNYFKPADTIHRSEAAAILNRVLHPEKRQSVTLHMPQLPDKNGALTIEGLLAILENYDPDAAFIYRSNDADCSSGGGAYPSIDGAKLSEGRWTLKENGTGKTIADLMRTDSEICLATEELAVATNKQNDHGGYRKYGTETYRVLERMDGIYLHELVHGFCDQNFMRENIYLGDGKYIKVPVTATYKTEEMAGLLPQELRTVRYDKYVGKGSPASSNVCGIYGLLNEFTAYYWGNRCTEEMMDYYMACYPTDEELETEAERLFPIEDDWDILKTWSVERQRDDWKRKWDNERQNIGDIPSDNFLSYAEFRFWILSYMLYAKEHYPEVYQGVLKNENFRIAYTYIDKEFKAVNQQFLTRLEKEVARREEKYTTFTLGSLSGKKEEYDPLMEIMARPEYVEMQSLLTCDLSTLDTIRLPQGVTK